MLYLNYNTHSEPFGEKFDWYLHFMQIYCLMSLHQLIFKGVRILAVSACYLKVKLDGLYFVF